MDLILLIFIMGVCFTQGFNAYTCEKQNKVFTKRNLPLKDVKAYNHFCGKLLYGFGIVLSLTMLLMIVSSGWIKIVPGALMILESMVLVKYYSKKEITFLIGH